MSKERYAEHTVAWELPNGDSVTKSNYNLSDIGTKYIPIQTEIGSDNKDQTINELQQRIAELEEQLKNSIRLKFKIGDYFIEYWDKTPSIYQYQGNKHFKCLNKEQGYHCDYVILGALLLEEGFIQQISKKEAEAKLRELQEK